MNTSQTGASAPIQFQFHPHRLRVIIRDGNPWFVAADIGEVLGYRNAPDMTRILDDDEKGTQIVRTPGGEQQMTLINESGLYSLILGSRKPKARRFKKWVTSEVLPSIRKTGGYGHHPDDQAQIERLQNQVVALSGELLRARPDYAQHARYLGLGLDTREIALLLRAGTRKIRRVTATLTACGLAASRQLTLWG